MGSDSSLANGAYDWAILEVERKDAWFVCFVLVGTNSKCGCPSVSILCHIREKKKIFKEG
jgi:hypothetical protein